MKDLYLHIGAHKTASSFIQEALFSFQEGLRRHSIKFLDLRSSILQRLLATSPIPKPELDHLKCGFQEVIGKLKETGIVLSLEGFFGNPNKGYNNIRAVAEDLNYLVNDSFNVKNIIAYVRRQDTLTYLIPMDLEF